MKKLLFFGAIAAMLSFPMFAVAQDKEVTSTPEGNPYALWQNVEGADFETIRDQVEQFYEGKHKGRGSGYKQYKRWEYLTKRRLLPDGSIVNRVAKTWQEWQDYRDTFGDDTRSHGYWASIGPSSWVNGPIGYNPGIGRVNCFAFHPTNTSIFWAGTPSGGVWRTTNGGSSWTNLTDGMPLIGVSGIAVNYSNTNIMYILTGDGDGGDTFSIGVLKTTDGGVTWKTTGLSWSMYDFRRGYKLKLHPTDPTMIFAATSLGLYKSTDSGANWTNVRTGNIFDFEFRPGTPATMYCTTASSFYRSTNTGDTWTLISSGTPTGATRTEIGVSAANSSYVYLLSGPATAVGSFKGVYRSTDIGLNFSLRASTPNLLGYESDGMDAEHQTTYDLTITVDPGNVNIVYIGGINTWKSTDGGTNWTCTSLWDDPPPSTIGYTHADVHELIFNGSTNLYCGSDGGVFRSANQANDWTDLSSGLVITQIYRMGGTDATADLIMLGTQDNGCNKWTPTVFTHVDGADGFECVIDYTNSNIVYTCRQYGSIYRSTDQGNSHTSIRPAVGDWITPYHLHPTVNTTIFGGFSNVYRTTNSGSSWTDIGDGLAGYIQAMTPCPSNVDRLYVATETGIARSDNCNAVTPTWTTITTGVPATGNEPITYICVNPANSNQVFVTLGGYYSGRKVYYSSNAGAAWTNISGTLPNLPINCIVYEPGSTLGTYIGTDVGVFYRNSTIGDWIPYMNGLPNVIIMEIEIRASQLTAATYGRGFWRSALYSSCPASLGLTQANDPSNPLYTGFQHYEAGTSITSSRIITGGIGTDVFYQAGSYVDLVAGFHARADNLFQAVTGPCTAKSVEPIKVMGLYTGPMEGVEVEGWRLK